MTRKRKSKQMQMCKENKQKLNIEQPIITLLYVLAYRYKFTLFSIVILLVIICFQPFEIHTMESSIKSREGLIKEQWFASFLNRFFQTKFTQLNIYYSDVDY